MPKFYKEIVRDCRRKSIYRDAHVSLQIYVGEIEYNTSSRDSEDVRFILLRRR